VCVVPFVVLTYSENGRFETTACPQQLFTVEKCHSIFGKQAEGKMQVHDWFSMFRSGVFSVENAGY
jgi:hypothetical protein